MAAAVRYICQFKIYCSKELVLVFILPRKSVVRQPDFEIYPLLALILATNFQSIYIFLRMPLSG